jgi:lipase chaperone LimK
MALLERKKKLYKQRRKDYKEKKAPIEVAQ